jgi:hypothetical protein
LTELGKYASCEGWRRKLILENIDSARALNDFSMVDVIFIVCRTSTPFHCSIYSASQLLLSSINSIQINGRWSISHRWFVPLGCFFWLCSRWLLSCGNGATSVGKVLKDVSNMLQWNCWYFIHDILWLMPRTIVIIL